MDEDLTDRLRAQFARRLATESGSERGEAAAQENREPGTGANTVGWDQQDQLRSELPDQEGREAAAGLEGEWDAEEPGPSKAGGGSEREPGSPQPSGSRGGELAGRRERRGEPREGQNRQHWWKPGSFHPGTIQEMYWERSKRRYRERALKLSIKNPNKWKYRQDKKPHGLTPPRPEEPKEIHVYKEDLLIPSQARRPTVRFSFQTAFQKSSQWSTVSPSGSVINELAKMGDPDVLEMVQQGGSRLAWRGDPGGTLAARPPGSQGRSWMRCTPRETAPARRMVPARVGERGRVNRGSPASELGQRKERASYQGESPSLARMTAVPGVGPGVLLPVSICQLLLKF